MKITLSLITILILSGCSKMIECAPLPELTKAPVVDGVKIKFVNGHLDTKSTEAILPMVKKLRGSVKFYENQIDKYNVLR